MRFAIVLAGALFLCGSIPSTVAITPSPSPSPLAAPYADQAARAISRIYARNAGVKSYSFDASVHITLHRFPWLRFRLNGHGIYERAGQYRIQFDSVPWWARGFDHFDLTSLDPHSWIKQYDVASVSQRGDSTVLAMKDPHASDLSGIEATIDLSGVRQIKWLYDYGGYVDLRVTPGSTHYILPAAEDAEIVTPRMAATAHADFTNYHVITDAEAASAASLGSN